MAAVATMDLEEEVVVAEAAKTETLVTTAGEVAAVVTTVAAVVRTVDVRTVEDAGAVVQAGEVITAAAEEAVEEAVAEEVVG